MDWLRSEDLKEEKNVTTPVVIIAVEVPIALCRRQAEFTRRSASEMGMLRQRWCKLKTHRVTSWNQRFWVDV